MIDVFLKLFNMSLTAGWTVIGVILLRTLFGKAPKRLICGLWSMVAVRLICPFSIKSILSIIPATNIVSPEIMYSTSPVTDTGISAINNTVSTTISQYLSPATGEVQSINPMQAMIFIATIIWIAGFVVMLLYTLINTCLLKRKLKTAVHLHDNIWQTDNAPAPFVFGMIDPKIYLPFNIGDDTAKYVIAHERAHIRRKDNIIKPFGFFLLCIYWYNPLMWLAYCLFCKDIELACDECVIRKLESDQFADYAEALLLCSTPHRPISVCPIAFGETSVKERVKKILNYKKPALMLIIAAVCVFTAAAVLLLTDPISKVSSGNIKIETVGSERDDVNINVTDFEEDGGILKITVKWDNDSDDILLYGEQFNISIKEDDRYRELETSDMWLLPSYPVAPKSSETDKIINKEHEYIISDYYVITQPGEYRFSTEYFFDGDHGKSYTVWVDFRISEYTVNKLNNDTVTKILNGFNALGITYAEEDVNTKSGFLSGKVQRIDVDNASCITVYSYTGTHKAALEATYVSDDGCSINKPGKTACIEWIDTPHWYLNGKSIVLYVGSSEDVLQMLEAAFGKQFAGM